MRTLLIFSLTAIICLFSTNSFAQSISITATHDTICVGTSVTFSATASGTATPHYQWYKNSTAVGTDSTAYTTTALNNGDIIECLLSASVGGPTIALSSGIVMHVYTMPAVSAIHGPDSVCRNAIIILTNDSTGGTWSSHNTAIAAVGQNNGHVLGNAVGLDTIVYRLTNYCGTATDSITIKVKAPPVVASVQGAGHLCTGAAASLYTDSTTGGIWSSTNTAVAAIDSITGNATPLTNGNINIVYSVSNNCGTTTRSRALIVSSAPVTGTIAGSTTVCQSDTIHLHDQAPGGTWTSSDANIALVSAAGGAGPGGAFGLLAGIMPGTITIKYVVINFCGADSTTTSVTVDPLPVVYPIMGGDSVCPGGTLNLSQIATGGAWASSTSSVATIDAGGVLTAVAAGVDTVSYSLTNNCGTTTQTLLVYVSCPLAVNNVMLNNSISIFPNPAHDAVYVKGIQPAAIHVVNMYGQLVKTATNTNSIHIASLPAGIYFVQVCNADGLVLSNQRLEKF